MKDLFSYQRRKSNVVYVGNIDIGGDSPVRTQSMTTIDTNNTEACIEQVERTIQAGGELVRLITQGRREAENLKNIHDRLHVRGYDTPLVADVHFNANVADVAVQHTEKVRIDPGSYVDPARKFIQLEYMDEEYTRELKKIEDRFVPLLNICKANHTAIRMGVNHGSLSDRIRDRYGDTPEGIIEGCMESLRICKKQQFDNVVISIKASSTVVMVQSVRLLVDIMDREDMHYPLHFGVTEAGEGEDGRIKNAVGIGTLLADGVGDTIRALFSEEPKCEIPVAKYLVDYVAKRVGHLMIPAEPSEHFDYLRSQRHRTHAINNIGGSNIPIVITSNEGCKADYIYVGNQVPKYAEDRKYIVGYSEYHGEKHTYPIFPAMAVPFIGNMKSDIKFLVLQFGTPTEEYAACLKARPEIVVVCTNNHQNRIEDRRALVHEMMNNGMYNPVVLAQMYRHDEKSDFQLDASANMGALMIDGLIDDIWLMNDGKLSDNVLEDTTFNILQAGRLRMSKTEYASYPGCGRTLHDLQQTTTCIKDATEETEGLKIGIMGCVVNGSGEMADADYGYVDAGPGKVFLHRKQTCVGKNIPTEKAVEHLLKLIHEDQKTAKSAAEPTASLLT